MLNEEQQIEDGRVELPQLKYATGDRGSVCS